MTLVVLGAIVRLTPLIGPPHVLSAAANATTSAFKTDLLTCYRARSPSHARRQDRLHVLYHTPRSSFGPLLPLFSLFALLRPARTYRWRYLVARPVVLFWNLLARIGSAHTVLTSK